LWGWYSAHSYLHAAEILYAGAMPRLFRGAQSLVDDELIHISPLAAKVALGAWSTTLHGNTLTKGLWIVVEVTSSLAPYSAI